MPASWLQLSFKAPPAALDTVSNFLIERGSPGVVIKGNEVQAFFPRPVRNPSLKKDIQRFLRGIREIYPGIDKHPVRWKILKEKNWNSSWRRFFSPQKVGKGFWITPPWKTPRIAPPPLASRKVITIEPAMAFGTGTHATTRGCLEFLEKVAGSLAGKDRTALDVGTGSGILAIAMAKMGVRRVLAIDTDPVAIDAAQVNVRRNQVKRAVRLSSSRLGRFKKSFTVVVANLTAETIVALADNLKKRVSPKGHLILSGILKPKVKEVLQQFCPRPFKLIRKKAQGEWATLLLRRKG